ncbi:MAG: hypothetical protein KF687_14490 [Cyclobacteriaceae bacterium]|nr:hypothetical protein [Cyclobacteriaceae bacterium]
MSYLHSFEYSIQSSIGTLKKYIEENEKWIKQFENNLKENISNDSQLTSNDELVNASYYFNKYELEVQLLQEFKNTHRFSVFITMITLFEGKLKSLCEILEKKVQSKAKLKGIRGNHLQLYFQFLTEDLKIEKNDWVTHYNSIQNLKFLRNSLVHQEGLITDDERKIIEKTPGLTIHHSGQLFTINDDLQFLTDFINKIDLAFKGLIKSVDNYFKDFKTSAN